MSLDNRRQLLEMVKTAVDNGSGQQKACEVVDITPRTYQRWSLEPASGDRRCGPLRAPANKLTQQERTHMMAIANSTEFCDKSPIKSFQPLLTGVSMWLQSLHFTGC